MPVNKSAKIVQVYPKRLWNIFNYWISRAHQKDQIEDLDKVGFDETSVEKGHNYITTMVDLSQSRVLFATEGKGLDCIQKSVECLVEKKVDLTAVKQVCIDMSPSYISGFGKYSPVVNCKVFFPTKWFIYSGIIKISFKMIFSFFALPMGRVVLEQI